MDSDIKYIATAKKDFVIAPEKFKIPKGCQLPIIGDIKVYEDGKRGFTLFIQQNNMFYQPCSSNIDEWDIKEINPPVKEEVKQDKEIEAVKPQN